ncbi:MAG: transposase [Actinobacteria bacterium]|nr:transposase [Actinomycetota bacterium]
MAEDKKRNRRKFTDEFKRGAAALAIDTSRPIAQVPRHRVYESSLGRWVAQERDRRGDTDEVSAAERERLRELEREVAHLDGTRSADAGCGAMTSVTWLRTGRCSRMLAARLLGADMTCR